MKRGRKPKTGDRYPSGKLKQQTPDKGPLLEYELAAARQHLVERVTDPMWQKRAGWFNLTGMLPDYLTSAAHNFFNLHGLWRRFFVPRQKWPDMPRKGPGRIWVSTDPKHEHDSEAGLPDDPSLNPAWAAEVKTLYEQIRRQLSASMLAAVERVVIGQKHPENEQEWRFLREGLRIINYILNHAEPKSKRVILNERRSEFAKDVTQMLEVRNLDDAERFVIAYASANNVWLPSASKRGAKLAVQRMREQHPDFDKYLPTIVQLFNDGAVDRTGNRDRDYNKAYRLAKFGSRQERKKTGN